MNSHFSYLDQAHFRELYCLKDEPLKMQMYIEGIKCIKCLNKIESLKNRISGLRNFELNLSTQVLDVELENQNLKYSIIADEITQLGFHVIPLPNTSRQNNQIELENQKDLIRIGVAAFLSGNIMMFAFAIYFGLAGPLKIYFEWTQFALYLPFVTYVAWPFYQGFVSGLKNRQISIDGPMAIASVLGFLASSYHLMKGEGSIYFDSLSSFLLLILATRFLQKKMRTEFLKYLKPSALVETLKARIIKNGKTNWVRTDRLHKTDQIVVLKDEWMPVDGTLETAEALIDTSILNGESRLQRVLIGQSVQAGSKVRSLEAQFSVREIGLKTTFGQLLASVETLRSKDSQKSETSQLSDFASQVLLISVLSVALFLVALGFIYPEINYFERGLALIILACPCAMAFGTPLAMSLVMKRAQEEGLLLKSFGALEKVQKTKTVFLDKTGTLTSHHWQIHSWSSILSEKETQEIILTLESVSQHPVAIALRSLWSDRTLDHFHQFTDLLEIPSKGVSARYQGSEWFFGSHEILNQRYYRLTRDGQEVCRFQLQSFLQPEALEVVKTLVKKNLKVKLVSGDSQPEVRKIAECLGILPEDQFYELSAFDKMNLVKSEPHSMMIGDGANDSLALSQASVGVAIHGSLDLALKSSDVLLLKNDLGLVLKLFKFSDLAKSQVKRNLIVALVYNLIGASLAIFGLASPFVAALMMPASSLFILGFTWWGTQK